MVSPEPRPGLHGQVHEEEVAACATTHGSCTLPSRGNGLRFSSVFSCRESNAWNVRAEDGLFFFFSFSFFSFFFTRNGPPNVLMGGSNVVSRLINNSWREISRLLTLLLLLGHGFTILICYFVTKNCWGQGNNFENAISKFRLRRGWWWLLFTRKVCRC